MALDLPQSSAAMTSSLCRSTTFFVGGVAVAAGAILFLDGSGLVLLLAAVLITVLSFLSRREWHAAEQRHREEVRRLHTDAQEVLRAARESEERYALAAAGSNDGLWDWNLETGMFYCSDRWKAMLGLPVQASIERVDDWLRYVHQDDLAALRSALDDHLTGRSSHFAHEYRIRRADGETCWVLCRGVAVRDDQERPIRMAGSQTDMTERRRIQSALAHAAQHDPLTGLPNRTMVIDLLERSIRKAQHADHPFAVLFVDLDGFKYVNDIFGHAEGDRLLTQVCGRLKAVLQSGDVLARMGGDEFALVVQTVPASVMAQAIQHSLSEPFRIDGRDVRVSASIGIAYSSDEYSTANELLGAADAAMYRAKRNGRGRHQEFEPALRGIGRNDETSFQGIEPSHPHGIYYLNAPVPEALSRHTSFDPRDGAGALGAIR